MVNERERQDNDNYSKNFTRVPNILFASYKHLTKEEKFLYCTLRQVYWDMKPRFVSLRELSQLTGYARGALGSMLPRLNTCGLVHAEVRREKDKDGKEKGNAKYHISIPDIWELNRKYFESSPEEQARMDPSLKLVHETSQTCPPNEPSLSVKKAKPVREKGQACPPNEPSLSMKSAKLGSFRGQSHAQIELAKDNNKDTLKDREKDSTVPMPAKELPTSPQPDDLSLSLSQKNNSSSLSAEKPTPDELKPTKVDYELFDRLCRDKGYAADFKVPRNDKNNAALQELRQQGANAEQVEFVFNDIWEDKDSFWIQHRGKPSTVASQFTARVWKMTAPVEKRRTASGFTNWTDDKTVGGTATAEPTSAEPKKSPSERYAELMAGKKITVMNPMPKGRGLRCNSHVAS